MKLAADARAAEELQAAIQAAMDRLQQEVDGWNHLNRSGAVSGWNEVNESAVLAMRMFRARNHDVALGERAAERDLVSSDGLCVGRPDYYVIKGRVAVLREYKTGGIREGTGKVREDYKRQLLFYAGLLFDNYDIDTVVARLESLGGDAIERLISSEEASDLRLQVRATLDEANLQIRMAKGIVQLAKPSAGACEYCDKRLICVSFKQSQAYMSVSHDILLLEGELIDQLPSQSGQVVMLTIQDITSNQLVTLGVPAHAVGEIHQGGRYVFADLRRHAGALRWGPRSRIFSLD